MKTPTGCYSMAEVAEMLDITYEAISHRVRVGMFPSIHPTGQRIGIPKRQFWQYCVQKESWGQIRPENMPHMYRTERHIFVHDVDYDDVLRAKGESKTMNTNFSLTPEQCRKARENILPLIAEAYDNAKEHGFHQAYDDMMKAAPEEQRKAMHRTILLAKMALISSEVGEAVQALQHGAEDAFVEELADIVIRILDLCGSEAIDLTLPLLAKMMSNRKRPYLHGKEC